MTKSIVSIALVALFSTSAALAAAEPQARTGKRKRPVKVAPTATAQISFKVTDAATGAALQNVQITSDRAGAEQVLTDAQGAATVSNLRTGDITFIFTRGGYDELKRTVSLRGGVNQVSVALTAHPTARLTTTDGKTYDVDATSMEFGFSVPFVGYTKSAKLDVCRDGKQVVYTKGEVKSINGPAVEADAAGCCEFPKAQQISITLKTNETFNAILRDSCTGYKIDVISNRRDTGESLFVPLAKVKSIEFP